MSYGIGGCCPQCGGEPLTAGFAHRAECSTLLTNSVARVSEAPARPLELADAINALRRASPAALEVVERQLHALEVRVVSEAPGEAPKWNVVTPADKVPGFPVGVPSLDPAAPAGDGAGAVDQAGAERGLSVSQRPESADATSSVVAGDALAPASSPAGDGAPEPPPPDEISLRATVERLLLWIVALRQDGRLPTNVLDMVENDARRALEAKLAPSLSERIEALSLEDFQQPEVAVALSNEYATIAIKRAALRRLLGEPT